MFLSRGGRGRLQSSGLQYSIVWLFFSNLGCPGVFGGGLKFVHRGGTLSVSTGQDIGEFSIKLHINQINYFRPTCTNNHN